MGCPAARRLRSQDEYLTKPTTDAVSPSPVTLEPGASFAALLSKLPVKERTYAEKRDAAMESEPAKRTAWRNLCVLLLRLAGHSAKFNSKESVQFYTADGKYRMQVFALQDIVPGELTIHCRDVLDELIDKKLIRPGKAGENRYVIAGTETTLVIARVPNRSPTTRRRFAICLVGTASACGSICRSARRNRFTTRSRRSSG